MDNEATKVLNPQQDSETKKEQVTTPQAEQKEEKTVQSKEKKGSGVGVRTAATAAGAALGTSAAMAAEHIYEASVEKAEESPEEVTPEEKTEEATEEVQATAEPQTQHTVVEHVVTVKVEEPDTPVEGAVPEDGTYIDSEIPEPTPNSNEVEDNEIHVVGVAVQDNGEGGIATIAGLQAGDDTVLVVDVETDGRLDYAIHDDNQDGQIDSDEWHDISDENMSTAQVVNAYIEEAHEQGTTAVITNLDTGDNYQIAETEDGYGLASMDEPVPDDNMCIETNDNMPDYMNDADVGVMDA